MPAPRSSTKVAKKPAPVAVTKSEKTSTKRVRVVEPAQESSEITPSTSAVIPTPSADSPAPKKGALKKSKKSQPEAVQEPEVATEVQEEPEEEEEIDFLKGFESADEGEDSSDDEMEDAESSKNKFESTALPKVASDVQAKLEGKDKKKATKTGTIYLGRVPHGFHEQEMKSYFSQFGEVTRMRLSRNKKTGASKHYAFLEFAYASVAQIVQETMNNYLLAGHILVCKIVPEAEVHPKMWIGANRVFRVVPKARRDRIMRAAPKTDEQKAAITSRLIKREEAKRAKLAALGIDYEFAGYAGKVIATAPVVEVKEATPVKAIKAKKEKVVKEKKEKKSSEPAKKKARKSM